MEEMVQQWCFRVHRTVLYDQRVYVGILSWGTRGVEQEEGWKGSERGKMLESLQAKAVETGADVEEAYLVGLETQRRKGGMDGLFL